MQGDDESLWHAFRVGPELFDGERHPIISDDDLTIVVGCPGGFTLALAVRLPDLGEEAIRVAGLKAGVLVPTL